MGSDAGRAVVTNTNNQPADFGFSEEAALLKSQARRLLGERLPTQRLHAMVAGEAAGDEAPAWDRALWPQMVDLGWTSLALPESAGGLELPLVAIAGLVEEAGRAAVPAPLLPTLAVSLVLRACAGPAQAAMAELAGGASASLAMAGSNGSWAPKDTPVTRRRPSACWWWRAAATTSPCSG